MIASINGLVEYKDAQLAVITVGGIGVEVNATRTALEKCFVG